MNRWVMWGGAAVLVAGGTVFAVLPRAVEVDTEQVSVGPLQETVSEDGRTRVRARYTVSAPVAGTLARIELHPGDAVEPGAVLARLHPLPSPLLDPRDHAVAAQRLAAARDAHAQAQATVARAETALALARSTLARSRALAAGSASSPQALEQAEAEARMRDSELASTRFAERVAAHTVREFESALAGTGTPGGAGMELTSPVRGRVLRVLRESAGVVTPGEGLLELGDPDSLEVVVQVLSQNAVLLRPGMPASLTQWGGDGALPARVRRVEPSAVTHVSPLGVEEQRVNALLDLDDTTGDARRLGDGFAVEAEIVVWAAPAVTRVATSALFRQGPGWAVYRVTDGRTAVRAVTPGHRGPLFTEVRTGLVPGDRVVTHPAAGLLPGTRVQFRPD